MSQRFGRVLGLGVLADSDLEAQADREEIRAAAGNRFSPAPSPAPAPPPAKTGTRSSPVTQDRETDVTAGNLLEEVLGREGVQPEKQRKPARRNGMDSGRKASELDGAMEFSTIERVAVYG